MSSEKLPYFDPANHPLAAKLDEVTKRLERVEDVLLPLEPLYPMDMAARLLCITIERLRGFLTKNRQIFLPRYLLRGKKRMRFLTADEIRRIRRQIFRGPGVRDL